MKKCGTDPKVKKTLVRHCEQKIRSTSRKRVDHDDLSLNLDIEKSSNSSLKENELDQPTLCSSEALANYLSGVKKSLPPPLSAEDLNVDKNQLSSKMTRKLNFHFNDKIYRDLIELNANIELKTKKDKRPTSSTHSIKRDLEPNIEDFYEDEKEKDSPPNIPVNKPKIKRVKRIEDGKLHRLVASFENL